MRTLLLLRSLRTHKKVALEKGYGEIWQAGKSVGHIRAIEPAGAVVDRFAQAYREYAAI